MTGAAEPLLSTIAQAIVTAKIDIDLGADTESLGLEDWTGALVVLALLLSFAFIRTSARLMRSPKVPWWPGSVTPGGLHVHHLVFGIFIMLAAGFAEFAFDLESPGREIAAIAFGIGAGLTLDEFALFLHLEDVYWAEEGRKSVDVVVICVLIGAFAAFGLAPLGLEGNSAGAIGIVLILVTTLPFVVITLLKGKMFLGILGMFLGIVAVVASIRLGKPDSTWARWRYVDKNPKKLEKARQRFPEGRERFRNLIGGAPSR